QYLATSKMALDESTEQRDSTSPDLPQAADATKLRIQHELASWQENYRRYSTLLAEIDTSVSPTVEREVIEAELKRCEAKLSELFERFYLLQSTARSSHSADLPAKQRGNLIASSSDLSTLDVAQLRQQLSPNQLLLAYFLYREKL